MLAQERAVLAAAAVSDDVEAVALRHKCAALEGALKEKQQLLAGSLDKRAELQKELRRLPDMVLGLERRLAAAAEREAALQQRLAAAEAEAASEKKAAAAAAKAAAKAAAAEAAAAKAATQAAAAPMASSSLSLSSKSASHSPTTTPPRSSARDEARRAFSSLDSFSDSDRDDDGDELVGTMRCLSGEGIGGGGAIEMRRLLVMDASGGGEKNGTRVVLWHSNDQPHQHWRLLASGRVAPGHVAHLVLDVQGAQARENAPVHLWREKQSASTIRQEADMLGGSLGIGGGIGGGGGGGDRSGGSVSKAQRAVLNQRWFLGSDGFLASALGGGDRFVLGVSASASASSSSSSSSSPTMLHSMGASSSSLPPRLGSLGANAGREAAVVECGSELVLVNRGSKRAVRWLFMPLEGT